MKGFFSNIVRFRIPGFHCWPEAPAEHAYLRNVHRHIFYFEVMVFVVKSRQIEFIDLKQQLESYARLYLLPDKAPNITDSCEDLAYKMLHHCREDLHLNARVVSCLEDGENGAQAIYLEDYVTGKPVETTEAN